MININLNKKQRKKAGKKGVNKKIYYYFAIPVVAAAIVIITMQSIMVSKINFTKNTIVEYNHKIALLAPKLRLVEAVKKRNAILLEKINTIKTLKSKQVGPVGYLYYIQSVIPKFAWVNSLTYKGNTVDIDGIALDGQVVSLFMDNLNSTGFFGEASLGQTRENKMEGLDLQNFNISFNVKSVYLHKKEK